MPYILLIINVIIMASGQLLFKRSADYITANPDLQFPMNYLTNIWFFAAVFLFAISTIVWTQILTKLPLSVAYPIVSSTYIITVIGAGVIFHEQITTLDIVGVLLIMTGITITALQ
ncbi:MAG: EamA family transporter [Candidatus Saccharimonadales bacterium]